MPDPAEIRSAAQHAMFTKAAADPAYAATRGISCEFAQACLDRHVQVGEPALPERVERAARQPRPAATATAPQLLTSRRAE